MKIVYFIFLLSCCIGMLIGVGQVVADSSVSERPQGVALAKAATGQTLQESVAPHVLPTTIKNFRLTDHTGKSHELYRYKDSKAVVLFYVGSGCPIVRKSIPRLKQLRDEYQSKGVTFLLINANAGDDLKSIVKEASEFQIDLPILVDDAQLVTGSVGATRTGETLVINPNGWAIAYRGAMDDRLDYGAEKPEAAHHWLREAIDATLSGSAVTTLSTEAKGCIIDRIAEPKKVSYRKHIAPILQKKCVACHSEGNIGPFAMDSYEAVAKRKGMIREVLMTLRMPPWHADKHYSVFANDNSLTVDQTRSLVAWIEAGAPRGDGKDPLLDEPTAPTAQWTLGNPDIVVEIPKEMQIKADGVVPYRYMNVPFTSDKDVWVRGVEVLPGNKKVLHHVLVFLKYPDRIDYLQPEYEGGLQGYFAGYVPGQGTHPFPKGTAKFVPAGSTFVFQLHYSPTGKPEMDLTKLGLYLYKGKPKREFFTRAAYDTDFAIPPNSDAHQAAAEYAIDRDTVLYELSPHMHYRGKEFQYVAQYPDGSSEVLLQVPKYDFNWQTSYRFKEPKLLPSGTKIVCTGAFDNSAKNSMNPDPNSWIYFGEQTFEEMFIGYMAYAYKDPPSQENENGSPSLGSPITPESLVGTAWKAGRFNLLFESDGVLTVNSRSKGTWVIEGEEVKIQVGERKHTFRIDGDKLLDGEAAIRHIS